MKNVAYPLNIIKSKKILKYIFNHLRNHRKLILLNYSKFWQYKFELTIDDFKNVSKRIKIGGLNGYGKEYTKDKHELIFEGKYLNGKRNGKGIEYFENGDKKSEGEYLNGDIYEGIEYDEDGNEKIRFENGKGKELYDNGLIKFEGKYSYGKKWTGKGYTYYGIKLFEIKNGNGYIREYNSEGSLLFKGNYLNGERNGKGKEYSHGKLLFEGNYLNDKRCSGKIYLPKHKRFYKLNRIRRFSSSNIIDKIKKSIFSHFIETLSKLEYPDFLFDLNSDFSKNNIGKKNLNYFEDERGNYAEGIRDGKGKEYNNGQLIFEGEFINWKRNGKGKEYFLVFLIFEGEYMDGKRNGFGKEYYINGAIKFKGEYQDGKINGKGKEYDCLGRLIFEGEYVDNKRMNGLVYKYKNNDLSKYEFLIPSKFASKYENKVPINIRKKYYNKYHIKSSCLKRKNFKIENKKCIKEKYIDNKRKNIWKKNNKCRWLINNWR